MKTPAEILAKTENGLPQPSWISRTPTGSQSAPVANNESISTHTKTMVNMIFARFMSIYGHKFKSCFENENEIKMAKREWALSLRDAQEGELVAAVNRCKDTLAWMPTISEFLQILQDLRGDAYPPVYQAYQEACRHAGAPTQHPWSAEVIYYAGRETGWFQLRSEEEAKVLPQFSYHYQLCCDRHRRGVPLGEPNPKPLEDRSDQTLYLFIQKWAEEQKLPLEVASKLLFFLTRPKGSQTRAHYREQAQLQAKKISPDLELPESIDG